ncbi:MAG: hypothetical protein WCK15_21815 [Pirellula sp.]
MLHSSLGSGERGRKRAGITQIPWDFESGVLRNVGKDEARRLSPAFRPEGHFWGRIRLGGVLFMSGIVEAADHPAFTAVAIDRDGKRGDRHRLA